MVVTSDHGGYRNMHGQVIYGRQADTVPVVISGRNVAPGRIPGLPRNYDVTASALAHFGVSAAGLDATRRDLASGPTGATRAVRRLSRPTSRAGFPASAPCLTAPCSPLSARSARRPGAAAASTAFPRPSSSRPRTFRASRPSPTPPTRASAPSFFWISKAAAERRSSSTRASASGPGSLTDRFR